MIRILTDLPDSDIPILPGLHVEVLSDPSMENKVTVVTCEDRVLELAFRLIKVQQTIIDKGMGKVIYLNDAPTKHAA